MDPTITSKHLITSALHELASISHNNSTTAVDDQTNPFTTYVSRLPNKPTNPLTSLPSQSATTAKSALLTLHFLFPFDFLPALDLIDRQLVQKLVLDCPQPDTDLDPSRSQPSPSAPLTQPISVFYIQSASAQSSTTSTRGVTGAKGGGRFGNRNYAATRVHYEVRLEAWNCSCPAFAAAWLRLILQGNAAGTGTDTGLATERAQVGSGKAEAAGEDHAVRSVDGSRMLIGGVATREDALVPVCKHILAAALCDSAPGLFGGGMKVRDVSVGEMAAWAAGWGET